MRASQMIDTKIFGIVGWSGSGKTSLMKHLLPELINRGLRVSTMKHTHHDFDIDRPGKDSHLHREAGAHEVLITGSRRWALLHENRDAEEPNINDLLARMDNVDLVLIEGFKSYGHTKLEVYRSAVGKTLMASDDNKIVAVASDVPLSIDGKFYLDLNNASAIADFIIAHCGFESQVQNGAA